MNDATEHFRVLINNDESSSSSFQSTVFWSVNVVLITLSTALFVWCVCGGGSHFLSNYLSSSGASTSDAAYRERIRQLHVQIEEEKKEAPEERRKKLTESFHRNKVHMIVESNDFVEESMEENLEEEELEDAHETIMNATESMMEGATTTTATIQEKEEDYNSFMNAIEMGSSTTAHDDTATDESMVVMKILDTCSTDKDDYDNNNNDEAMMKAVQDEDYNAAMNAIEMGNNTAHDKNATNESMVMMKNLDTCSTDKDDYDNNDEVMMKAVVQELHVETGVPGYIKLRTVSGKRTVPNCCAVCLCPYTQGETIVWSSNGKCPHAFHKDCVVEWLIKMQIGTPCPCCRQEFTDLNQFQIE